MNNLHLIIAHPEPSALNHSIKNTLVKQLTATHSIDITDVYQLHQQGHPATQPWVDPHHDHSLKRITEEQQRIQRSQITVLQFPLYWFSVPGILKNYIDQVFRPGFAYPGKYTESPLHDGRAVLFSVTTQSPIEAFTNTGPHNTLKNNLLHLATTFRFVGYRILQPVALHNAHHVHQDTLEQHINTLTQRITNHLSAPSIWLNTA